ncbi:uncharacterized protein VTP21DRAFT_9594 [Calcarisporiella thermophila]|uniref:uncharacterized protein n=1 Tax=Calcarisporiella thermophila TaxID=911321 RepID=UPI00374228D1
MIICRFYRAADGFGSDGFDIHTPCLTLACSQRANSSINRTPQSSHVRNDVKGRENFVGNGGARWVGWSTILWLRWRLLVISLGPNQPAIFECGRAGCGRRNSGRDAAREIGPLSYGWAASPSCPGLLSAEANDSSRTKRAV